MRLSLQQRRWNSEAARVWWCGKKDQGWRPYIGAEAAPAQPELDADARTRRAEEGRRGARKRKGAAR
uniref:Uncharacterized protein n=1 Tax=Setaria viridis TaxID=4556 RepID=A0A4U6V4D1_SETVI|nr:hypothetical protein SEVIR_5G442950v2 [Setaria viridis]